MQKRPDVPRRPASYTVDVRLARELVTAARLARTTASDVVEEQIEVWLDSYRRKLDPSQTRLLEGAVP